MYGFNSASPKYSLQLIMLASGASKNLVVVFNNILGRICGFQTVLCSNATKMDQHCVCVNSYSSHRVCLPVVERQMLEVHFLSKFVMMSNLMLFRCVSCLIL